MIDFEILANYIISNRNKSSDFYCQTIYSGNNKTDFSVYLISGDFTPFIFSNNKIYNITAELLYDYYQNHTHKGFLYYIQEENKKHKN
jgi:hypothetical protein